MKIVCSSGVHMFDETGRKFLDCVSGVSQVGHCHPRVVSAGQQQMARVSTFPDDPFETLIEVPPHKDYCERLTQTMPDEKLNTVMVCRSGSEANDIAIQLCRRFTGHEDIVVFESAFHGSLGTVADISPKIFRRTGGVKKPWVHVLPVPDLYRGRYLSTDPDALEKYFLDSKAILDAAVAKGRKIACLITEPIFTFHSMVVPESTFFNRVCNYIRQLGGLVVLDEVQTGLARVGSHWWGFQIHPGLVPDLMTTGKPLGNGYPIAVVVTSQKIANSLGYLKDMYVPTRNQAAIGSAVLDVINDEKLMNNAKEVGEFMMESIKNLQTRRTNIGCVRGCGLLIGIDLVWDQELKRPAKQLAEAVLYQMREEGVITAVEGVDGNMLFLIPPLQFSTENAMTFTRTLDGILESFEKGGPRDLDLIVKNGLVRFTSWNNLPIELISDTNPKARGTSAGSSGNGSPTMCSEEEDDFGAFGELD